MRDYRDAYKLEQARRSRAETDLTRVKLENRELKAARDRHPLKHLDRQNRDTLQIYLDELGWLVQSAHPLQGGSDNDGGTSKSAGVPTPGAGTEWARYKLRRELRRLRAASADLQSVQETPHGERVLVDPDGKCVACGKLKRGRRRVGS